MCWFVFTVKQGHEQVEQGDGDAELIAEGKAAVQKNLVFFTFFSS